MNPPESSLSHAMTNTAAPRFSVVIPTYNRRDFVGAAIESVLAQDFPDFELIVVDDGSTDDAPVVINRYRKHLKLICQPNLGAEAARTAGVQAACGDYIVLLDNDDLLFPDALRVYDRILRHVPDTAAMLAAVVLIYDHQALPPGSGPRQISYLQFADYLSRDVPVSLTCSQLVVKRSIAIAAGAFRPRATAFPFDIPDMLLKMGTSGPFLIVRSPSTVAYRQHTNNTVKRIDYMVSSSSKLAEFERQGEYPGGPARRFDRYACIGTMALFWAYKAFRHHRYALSCRLLFISAPMILAGLVKRMSRRLRRSTPLRRLATAG